MNRRHIIFGLEIFTVILVILCSTVLPLNTVAGVISIPISGTQTNTAQLPSCPGSDIPGYGSGTNYPKSPQHDRKFHILSGQLGSYKTSREALKNSASAIGVPGGCPFQVTYRLYL